jgi:hypothetical protein
VPVIAKGARRHAGKGAAATVGAALLYATPSIRRLDVARAQTVGSLPPPPPPPPPPAILFCGRSPGFWKNAARNHPQAWALVAQAPNPNITASTTLAVAFGPLSVTQTAALIAAGLNPATTSLQVAIEAGGGGVIALTRHAVAALLNAYAFGSPPYTYPAATVIAMYTAALSPGGNVDGTALLFANAEHPGGRECPI